jgi:hypothetical protein
MSENIKVNKDGTISPIDPTKPSSFTTSTNQSSIVEILDTAVIDGQNPEYHFKVVENAPQPKDTGGNNG